MLGSWCSAIVGLANGLCHMACSAFEQTGVPTHDDSATTRPVPARHLGYFRRTCASCRMTAEWSCSAAMGKIN
jgi:hypothetical protein